MKNKIITSFFPKENKKKDSFLILHLGFKNKKGVWFIIPLIIIGILIISGGLTAWKINQITSSIPKWLWYVLIGILILLILPKKK